MNPLIECCEQNLANGGELILSDPFIEENSDIVTYSCMNECVLCAQTLFVLFEGERIVGETPESLVENIKKALVAWQEEMG
ncbi:DUF1450 domain-containing protein [Enterococcus sp. DIV0242_7C1]|uniref:Uncharacterized protein n=1 Tax=Candidatus Enterococcus dunnyi TaxID=1834192 RepID=A0A200IW09_9ENTE|nr:MULTISPECIES: DUF1450 domain-containing protein [unclassified Enterococcus]MBO0471079.1 DUF1450 domain-containing protein [Enterococcus sp. DIV0242_7C1]MCA5014116.1 DUF1450 domain-containing protein [Enterococcus sp. S23]MCA5017110.1 DUF1450 domain-containing protein [Enterococcus sp. S22(2020)]OUZ28525.1 hypothetical protein A5889_003281 [Enterococcus sp. 9D6_DIV0238]